ncbi:hypothetical protein V6N11_014105 [Hibiscus sabdariffa]|uniref:Uncharacterized protein n=2 Tax=Hibiscus sabdariffa TaxID=183260 RepID=A0ABR2AYD6_9ROSI
MHRSNHHLLRRVDTLSLPFTGSVVPRASRFMLRSPQESEWEYRRGPGDENDASTVKRIIKCWLQLRVCSCSVKGSQLMFERLCKLTTIASYGPSHPSYEEESESENGMKGESNAFRRESSDSSRENEPKERETGNAFSTYGFSRGPLGVLRNQVCQRKTMTLSLNMLPMNKESHSICHLFPRFVTINMPPTRKVCQIKMHHVSQKSYSFARFRIEFVQDRSESTASSKAGVGV